MTENINPLKVKRKFFFTTEIGAKKFKTLYPDN